MGFALRVWALNKVSIFACFILTESGFKTLGGTHLLSAIMGMYGNVWECIPKIHTLRAFTHRSTSFRMLNQDERNRRETETLATQAISHIRL